MRCNENGISDYGTSKNIVFLTYSKEQRKDYFTRCFSFRHMGIKWLVITILFFALISVVGIGIGVYLLGYPLPEMAYIHAIIQNPLNLFLVLFLSVLSGPLNEEFGWRGYALDKLFIKFGFTRASVMLFNFAVSYVYIKTKRSILAGALVHMFSNLLESQLLSPYSTEISMTLQYTKMFFCGCLTLYCIFSKSFNEEYNNLFRANKDT